MTKEFFEMSDPLVEAVNDSCKKFCEKRGFQNPPSISDVWVAMNVFYAYLLAEASLLDNVDKSKVK